MKNYTLLALILLTASAAAEEKDDYVIISCPDKSDVKISKNRIEYFTNMIGSGDFMPFIDNNPNIAMNNLYVVDGIAERADYLATITWSVSLNKIGVSCYFEINKLYKSKTNKNLSNYYKKAVMKGLKWELKNP